MRIDWCGREICEKAASTQGYDTHIRLGERACEAAWSGLQEAREKRQNRPKITLEGKDIRELQAIHNDHYDGRVELPQEILRGINRQLQQHYRALGVIASLDERTDIDKRYPVDEEELRNLLETYPGVIMCQAFSG